MPNAVRTSVYPAMIGSLNRTSYHRPDACTAARPINLRSENEKGNTAWSRGCRDSFAKSRSDGLRFHDGNVGPRRMHTHELEPSAAEQFAVLLARALLPA